MRQFAPLWDRSPGTNPHNPHNTLGGFSRRKTAGGVESGVPSANYAAILPENFESPACRKISRDVYIKRIPLGIPTRVEALRMDFPWEINADDRPTVNLALGTNSARDHSHGGNGARAIAESPALIRQHPSLILTLHNPWPPKSASLLRPFFPLPKSCSLFFTLGPFPTRIPGGWSSGDSCFPLVTLVGEGGIEPPTPCLEAATQPGGWGNDGRNWLPLGASLRYGTGAMASRGKQYTDDMTAAECRQPVCKRGARSRAQVTGDAPDPFLASGGDPD
jgi:hypothetical protein